MKNIPRLTLGIMLIGVIEGVGYRFFYGVDLFSYFAIWAILFLILLLSSVFGLFGNSYSGQTIIGGLVKGSPLGQVDITDDMTKPKKKIKDHSGLFKSVNIIYVVAFILNVMACLLVR